MKHFLGIEELSKKELLTTISNSKSFLEVSERKIKKVPTLRGKTIINLFFENSTRTRASFEIAGKRMSADTINITASGSSSKKGESMLDTVRNLEAMNPDVIVVRDSGSGICQLLAKHLTESKIANAGDGQHEHPTQAILDCLTLSNYFEEKSDSIENKTIAIVGDIRHSRVARSNIWAHLKFGNKIRLIGPPTLIPEEFKDKEVFGDQIETFWDLKEGLKGVDIIMVLRMQLERMSAHFVPSLEEYTNEYFVTTKLIEELAPNAVIMHPGPVNRGVEVESKLIDGKRSLMSKQVTAGVAVRMAVLYTLITSGKKVEENELISD